MEDDYEVVSKCLMDSLNLLSCNQKNFGHQRHSYLCRSFYEIQIQTYQELLESLSNHWLKWLNFLKLLKICSPKCLNSYSENGEEKKVSIFFSQNLRIQLCLLMPSSVKNIKSCWID